ncbi:17372_t:CDS:2 [Entrophospora sp. SA101]|nr:17372_t:CDS:2 [Entrophospora sp. SA101]
MFIVAERLQSPIRNYSITISPTIDNNNSSSLHPHSSPHPSSLSSNIGINDSKGNSKNNKNNQLLKHRKNISISSISVIDDVIENNNDISTTSMLSSSNLPLINSPSSSSSFKKSQKKNNNKNSLMKKFKDFLPFLIWVFISLITLCTIIIFRKKIINILDHFSNFLKSMGIIGVIIIFFIIFLTTFPLILGYGTMITLTGFTYGFFIGFLISYLAALFGAVTVFWLSRRWFGKSVRRLLKKYKSMGAVVKAVEKKGFKLLFLIRIAPYPYNVLNALLSATHISTKTFTSATALSLFKLMIHTWIGSKISSFSAHMGYLTTSTIGIGVMIYIWMMAKKVIKEVEEEQLQISEKKEKMLRHNSI